MCVYLSSSHTHTHSSDARKYTGLRGKVSRAFLLASVADYVLIDFDHRDCGTRGFTDRCPGPTTAGQHTAPLSLLLKRGPKTFRRHLMSLFWSVCHRGRAWSYGIKTPASFSLLVSVERLGVVQLMKAECGDNASSSRIIMVKWGQTFFVF